MRRQLEQVEAFHREFGCHLEEGPTANLDEETTDVRARLIDEELAEYRQAVSSGDVVQVADALSDLMYVLLGTYLAHGLQRHAEALFDEVHRSNMSKLDENGRPVLREDGKILKPSSWSPPQLGEVLTQPPQE